MSTTENTNRSVFALNGVTGMLIATLLLLTILATLVTFAIQTQRAQSTNFYDPAPIVGSLDNVKPHDKGNAQYGFVPAK